MPADPFGCDRFAERQDVAEHAGGKPVGHDQPPSRFETKKLRGGPLRQEIGERAERGTAASDRIFAAGTAPQPYGLSMNGAEYRSAGERTMTFHGPGTPAIGTAPSFLLVRGDLVGHDRILELGHDCLGFGERQPECLRGKVVALDGNVHGARDRSAHSLVASKRDGEAHHADEISAFVASRASAVFARLRSNGPINSSRRSCRRSACLS